MFVPLRDDNPLKHIQFQTVTTAIVLANIAVFLLSSTGATESAIASFAVIPSELFGLVPQAISQTVVVPENLTLLSYQFFHGDIWHLVGNMLFLWVFGDNVEDAMGHIRFLIFYLLCGILAGLTHAFIAPTSGVPLIGASGSVAGVIAAYLMLHPKVQVWVLAFSVLPMRISATIVLGAWIVTQIVMVLTPQIGPVAWWAHIGGLVAGALLVIVFKRSDVRLFDKGLPAGARIGR
ncbi:MAG: rhomboid family intramembrane serine protease [Hyphomicrobiaceae bacterium]|nr:rhomboid family intramembrane serine protease [Hyphomicrobiaceae bacterium]